MQVIHKYKLKTNSTSQYIELPKGYEILSVGIQDKDIVMWVKVDPYEQQTERALIETYMTGEHINTSSTVNMKFLGTLTFENPSEYFARIVTHVFEVR